MKLYRKRVQIVAKKLHPYPYTSNPRYRTKERKMEGMNTTLYFWRREKNQEVLMCFCVFWERNMVRKERERERGEKKKSPERCLNSSQNVSLQSELPGAFQRPQHAFWGPVHLVAVPSRAQLTSTISSSCTFSFLMSSFQKTKEIKIPTVGSKFMTSGSVLMRFSQFSQYLNRFSSDSDPKQLLE